ncbi:PspC domain-containing protein [Kitasatospora sp. NPDC052896]|uniref:PspC domain-containing protein n=1 Tax=Kitasatospora sp. NPDC052896 TaxID=3364061 RepID=UPI0037C7D115
MTDEQSAAQDRPAGEAGPEDQRPPLTRTERHRVVAGVCGGLGRHLDIDPVVFRVVVAVLCLTGGLGLFLYGLAWLVIPLEHPEGKHGRTELQRVLTGRVDGQSIGAVLLTVIGTGVFFSWMGSGDSAFPLVLLGAMIFFAVRYDPERRRRAAGLGTPPRPGGPYDRPTAGANSALTDWKTWRQEFHEDWTARKAAMHREWEAHQAELHQHVNLFKEQSRSWAAGGRGTEPADAPPTPPPGATGYLWDPRHPERNPYGDRHASTAPGAPAQPWWQRTDLPAGDPLRKSDAKRSAPLPPERPCRPRSFLAPLGLLVSAGAGWAVWWTHGRTMSTSGTFATVLATGLLGLGLTMLLGTRFGRARVLVLPALVITLTLAVFGSTGSMSATIGDRSWAPATASDVQRQYDLAAGDLALDLSAVDPGGGTVGTAVRVGAGDVHVTVPSDVAVDLTVHTAAGDVQLPAGGSHGGLGTDRSVRLAPADGVRSKGDLTLDIQVGLGDVEVVQA